jgi:hypothetical protein
MVNSGDADNNTWPRSADCRERRVEMTVDDCGREQNPKKKDDPGDMEAKHQGNSKSNFREANA